MGAVGICEDSWTPLDFQEPPDSKVLGAFRYRRIQLYTKIERQRAHGYPMERTPGITHPASRLEVCLLLSENCLGSCGLRRAAQACLGILTTTSPNSRATLCPPTLTTSTDWAQLQLLLPELFRKFWELRLLTFCCRSKSGGMSSIARSRCC